VNGALFCLDKTGDQENRIFGRIYNGELPVYKRFGKYVIGLEWNRKEPKKKRRRF